LLDLLIQFVTHGSAVSVATYPTHSNQIAPIVLLAYLVIDHFRLARSD
jgi:hypothetical protein